jgi:hypothetical protein
MSAMVVYALSVLFGAVALATEVSPKASLPGQELSNPGNASGKVFYDPISKTEPAFLYEYTRSLEGKITVGRTRYLDLKGQVLVEEETRSENDNLIAYRYRQNQVEEHGSIEVRDGKVYYNFTSQGKVEADSHDIESMMIVPDSVPSLLQSNWRKIMAKETVRTRFLLVERQESIGFKFFLDKEVEWRGRPAIQVKMKPSSIIIAALVDPIIITVDKAPPHKLLEMQGRLPLRYAKKNPPKSRNDWRAIDARLVMD